MTHEQLERYPEILKNLINELTLYCNDIEIFMQMLNPTSELSIKLEIVDDGYTTSVGFLHVKEKYLRLPQDPKALLELYLTNARAELTRLQTEFDNL